VLYALRHPAVLLGLAVGFLVGTVITAALQQRVTTGRRLRVAGSPRRPSAPWTAYLDPYGAVAAIVSGVGWGARVAPRSTRGARAIGPLAVAVVVRAVLALVGFAAYRGLSGPSVLGYGINASDVLHGSVALGSSGAQIAVGFAVVNLACGLLALAPIPPLELGVVLWSRLPRTPGARRFAYHLLEEAWGIVIVLVGLLLPLAGQPPFLLALIDIVSDPILRLV